MKADHGWYQTRRGAAHYGERPAKAEKALCGRRVELLYKIDDRNLVLDAPTNSCKHCLRIVTWIETEIVVIEELGMKALDNCDPRDRR